MIGLSNNSYSTQILSTIILLLPTFVLTWIVIIGEITLAQSIAFGGLGVLFLLVNFYINFLIFNVYYDCDSRFVIIKRLGKTINEASSFDIDIRATNWYGMSLANFILILNGKKFRFRSKVVRFGFLEWLDRNNAAIKVKLEIMTTIARCTKSSKVSNERDV